MALGAERYPREEDGTPNWHRVDWTSNLDHCLEHAFNASHERNHNDPDKEKILGELSHAAARALMALEMFLIEEIING